MAQQAGAPVFHQVQHIFKTLLAAQVGVGHHRTVVPLEKLGQSAQFALVLRGAHGLGQAQVVPVHGQHQIKTVKVGRLELAGALG